VTKPRIHILIATFHPQVGGAERQALMQGQELRARGYDATIVTLRHDRSWPQHEVIEGLPVVRIAGAFLGGRQRLPAPLRKLAYLLGVLGTGWALWRRRHRYDLVHVYQLNLVTLPAACVCALIGKPLIVAMRCADSGHVTVGSSPHRKSVHPFLRGARQTDPHEERDQSSGDLEVLEHLGKPVVRLSRFLLRRAGAVIVVLSSRMKADLAAHGFHLAPVRVIPNGVDLRRFRPAYAEAPTAERAYTVLFVGRLAYQKGVDVLLHAWRIVREQLPESEQPRLAIVGTGPRQAQLEQLAATLDIVDSVEFAGLQRDVVAWLSRSDVLVLPSRWEGMPNAVLEAMASGLPCIATRVSGSEDIIQHGANGLLVAPDDPEELAGALLSLLRDPALGLQYGRAARATVEEYYSLGHVLDVYLALYQGLCGTRL
jgi:glycosyltransferase involved in cell wall biosynthesis